MCGFVEDGLTDTFGVYMNAYRTQGLLARYFAPTLQQWFTHHFDRNIKACPQCRNPGILTKMHRKTELLSVPSLLLVSVGFAQLQLDKVLTFSTDTTTKSLQIRGLIYHSVMAQHFTSIVVDENMLAWYHDGMTTRQCCNLLGRITDMDKLAFHVCGDYKLVAAIYGE
jgi:hypothetical protein